MRKKSSFPICMLAALFAIGIPERTALASPEYPRVVAETLGMDCPPKCVLCHQTIPGRGGNASRPFALALKEEGLEEQNVSKLREILTKLLAENRAPAEGGAGTGVARGGGADSDKDGTTDLEELLATPPTDPNGQTSEVCAADVEYGCQTARHAPELPSTFVAPLCGLLVAFAALGVRRRARKAVRS